MAESTAGIGEAGALINKASAPSGMDITRGLQMAERTALKKAQAEAAKEAKKQAKAASVAKMARVDTGKFKNLGVAKEAKERAFDLSARKAIALESGDYVSDAKLDIEADYLGNYLASKDNAISTLKSPKKYSYANKVGELIDSGKEEEAAKYNKAYAPVFVKGEMGDYIVEVPDAVDLNKVYSTVLKNSLKNDITFSSLRDAATDTDNYSINRKMTPKEIAMNTGNLLRDEGYVKSVLYNPDFQKFYDKKYAGSSDPSSIETGLYDYTQQRISDINQAKMSVKGKPSQNKVSYSTGFGVVIGGKELPIDELTGEEVFNLTYGSNEVKKGSAEAESSMTKQMKQIIDANPNATWFKTNIPDVGEITITDPSSGKTIDADIESFFSNGKKTWVVYGTKNINPALDKLQGKIKNVTPMTSAIFNRIYNKMAGSKKSGEMQSAINSFKEKGIDLSEYAKNIVDLKKGGSTPPPAKGGSTNKPTSLKPINNPLVSPTTKTR
jgi:hypothetical protein